MWKLVKMHRKYSLLRMQLNVSYLSSEHNWEKHAFKFASRLPVKRERKSNAVRLVYDCMEAILCKKYHAMVLYWRLRYSLHQHSFVNTPFFFQQKSIKSSASTKAFLNRFRASIPRDGNALTQIIMGISIFPRCVYDTFVCYCSFTLVIIPCLIV